MTGRDSAPAVAVVGSLNLDLVVRVARLPGPGETVTGAGVFRNPGGKGANQAVAAARAAAATTPVATSSWSTSTSPAPSAPAAAASSASPTSAFAPGDTMIAFSPPASTATIA